MTHAFFEDIDEKKENIGSGKKAFYQKPIYWIATILSLLWIWAAVDYMIGVEWWATRYRLPPAEFVGMVCGQALPLALIWFVVAWVDRRNQLEEETKTLRAYMNQLMYPTEEGAVYTQSLTNALRSQIKEFKVVFGQAADQTKIVREEMKRWIKDLAIVIDHVDTKTVASMKELAHHVQVLAKSTEKANESTMSITQSLSDRAGVLEATSDKVARIMGSVSGVLNENIAHVDQATESLRQTAEHTGEILKIADNTSAQFNRQMDRMEALMNEYQNQTNEHNERIFMNAEKILTVLKTQGALLDQEVEKTLHKMSQAGDKVIEQSAHLTNVSDTAVAHLNEVGTQLNVQTDILNQVLTETDARVRQLSSSGVEEQTRRLLEVSEKTDNFIKKLNADLQSTSCDQFMKDARLILEHLSTFAIDIVHVFTPKAEEEQWKKYYAGDNAAFMRYLMSAIPKDKVEAFKKLYRDNSTLRIAVTRYMSEFDALTIKAKNNEKKDVLLPVLIGSDAGRLYMILKQTLASSKKGGV